jgi:PEP-CTERM motif
MFRSVLKTALSAVASAAVLAWGASANATTTISIEIFDGASLIATSTSGTGSASISIFNDPNFPLIEVSALGVPVRSNPDFITSVNVRPIPSSSNRTLTVLATQQGLTGFPNATVTKLALFFSSNGTIASEQISNFVDAGNGAFAMTTPIGSFTCGPQTCGFTQGPILAVILGLGTFSETTQLMFNFPAGAQELTQAASFFGGVPEPSTWAMMLIGFAGLGFAFRHSRRKVSMA